jgi:hypothetical protein
LRKRGRDDRGGKQFQNGFVKSNPRRTSPTDKMPRNVTGGSGHKAQRNSEGSKARNNRCLVDDLLDDIRNGEKTDGVQVARVTKRMGCGRMEVFYLEEVVDEKKKDVWLLEDKPKKVEFRVVQQIVPMRGGLRGKGKKTVWVDLDSLVMIAETGLAGMTHEIVAVFSPEQVARLRKLKPDMDERYFLKGTSDPTSKQDAGFEFEEAEKEDEEVDIDNI